MSVAMGVWCFAAGLVSGILLCALLHYWIESRF